MQTKLAARAQRLSRRVFSSLPVTYRFGFLMEVLSRDYSSLKDSLGRTIYALFYQAGLEDLPYLGEAKQAKLEAMGPRAADVLPRGTGSGLAALLANMVRKKIPIESDAQDFMQDLLIMILNGKLKIDASKAETLRGAESYVKSWLNSRLTDRYRSLQRKYKNMPTVQMTDPYGGQFDIKDPKALRDIMTRIDPGDRQKALRELRSIDRRHPTWPEEYLLNVMDGGTNMDLVRQWGGKSSTIHDWIKRYLPAIQKVMMKYYRGVAAV